MTPSPDTIAAYLALPLAARRALAEKAEGPGWRVHAPAHRFYPDEVWPWPNAGYFGDRLNLQDAAWIPASEAETLRVWRDHVPSRGYGPARDLAWEVIEDGCGMLWRNSVYDSDYNDAEKVHAWHDGTYDGRLRAAAECCPVEAFGGR